MAEKAANGSVIEEQNEAAETEKEKSEISHAESRQGKSVVNIWSKPGKKGRTTRWASLHSFYYPEGSTESKKTFSYGPWELRDFIGAIEGAQSDMGMGQLSEDELEGVKPVVIKPNQPNHPVVIVKVGEAGVKIWDNGEFRKATVFSGTYQDNEGKTKDSHSFWRKELGYLKIAMEEAQKHMGAENGAAAKTDEVIAEE